MAVITGAASGFGFAFAQRAAKENMKLVLADINYDALTEKSSQLSVDTDRIRCVKCNVSKAEDIQALADTAFNSFGGVHLLFNNAGVAHAQLSWEHTEDDWNWVLGANLWSVIHAHRIFIPRMIKQKEHSHIINTASAAGLLSMPGAAAYNVSKHGVVTLSETLYNEFQDLNIKNVGVSVLCPAFVPTNIATSQRPADLPHTEKLSKGALKYAQNMATAVASGKKTAEDIANETFYAIESGRLYIVPHKAKIGPLAIERVEGIANERNPSAGI